jgi:hypothetical protein
MGFCSFLMKAELGKAGKNLLIPRWQGQQLTGRVYDGGEQHQWRVSVESVPGRLGFKNGCRLRPSFLITKSCVFWKKPLASLRNVKLHGDSFGSFGIFLSFFV